MTRTTRGKEIALKYKKKRQNEIIQRKKCCENESISLKSIDNMTEDVIDKHLTLKEKTRKRFAIMKYWPKSKTTQIYDLKKEAKDVANRLDEDIVQGHPTQTVFFETALTDGNM